MQQVPQASQDWKRPAMIGYAIIVLTFVVLGGWSAIAQIASAVIASGVVTVESNKKTAQHLEGGIVREILVREGQRVEEGQLLFRLDTTQPQANLEMLQNQLDAAIAQEARLLAERNDEPLVFPDELRERMDRPVITAVIADQEKQYNERRASLKGQISILESRIVQLETEISGLTVEKESTERQLAFIEQELTDMQYLFSKELVQKSRMLALEREKSRLQGIIGRSVADKSKAENSIGETRLQIQQLRQKFLEEVNTAILDVRQKIPDLRQRLGVAKDILGRLEIKAPRSGIVQNQRVFTIGAVVRGGEPLLDVVPENEKLIIHAQVSPLDIERIKVGMKTEVRFPAFDTRLTPVVFGRLFSLSSDRLVDEQTRQPYFLGQIVIDPQDMPRQVQERLTAGMPVEVIIPTGERTVIDYLVRPLGDRLAKTFRER